MVLGGLTMAEQPSLAVQASSIARPVAQSDDDAAQQRRRITRIKRAIRRQTSGGIRELAVDLEVGSVRLRGRCSSFYCKQMAQQAAMNFLPGETIVNEIEVAALPR
jgi:osmotically-inducible protein OsmY